MTGGVEFEKQGAVLLAINYCREGRMEYPTAENAVADIAARVGYDSASKFAAAFKKSTGMTPVEYRNEIRQEGKP